MFIGTLDSGAQFDDEHEQAKFAHFHILFSRFRFHNQAAQALA
jgi:hypothetical protein